jgi:predicted phosphohydrolase
MDNKNVWLKISTSMENALSPLKYVLTKSSKMGEGGICRAKNWDKGTFS